jgi:hypothetical protein
VRRLHDDDGQRASSGGRWADQQRDGRLPADEEVTVALTDPESTILQEISAGLRRDDPRLADALGCLRRKELPLGAGLAGLAAMVGAFLVVALLWDNPAAAVLAVTWAVLGPVALWIARRVRRTS